MVRRFALFTCGLALLGCGFGPQASDPPATGQAGTGAVAGSQPSAGSAQGGGGAGSSGTSPVTAQGGAGSAGAPVVGGAAGATMGGSAGDGGAGAMFTLLWRDDFDSFDAGRWTRATHTFEENLARFTEANAVVEGGLLKLRVTNVPNGDRPYSAAEVYTVSEFKYGRFEGRVKFCAGSGMVSSLFTYKDDVEQSWQEIDVEHLGNLPNAIQYNLIWGTWESRKYQPKVVTFGYSPASEFHDYAIEWKPDGVTFFVDGVRSHHDVQATLQDAAKLRMNAWPTNNAVTSFAGPLDTSAIPCEAQYDWVSVSAYTP